MAKNKIFSGKKLTTEQLEQIERQLAKSSERDIKAMRETNKRRSKRRAKPRLNKIKQYVGGARTGSEAHDRYKAIMDNIRKSDRDEVRGMDYEDVFDAADALVDGATDYWTADDLQNYIINLEQGNIF